MTANPILARMKHRIILAIGFACLVCVGSVSASIEEPEVNHNAGRKLGRGFANLLFGIVEVPNQIHHTSQAEGGGAAATLGVGRGIGKFLWREVVGVYEIVTFPVPAPSGYKPIIQPEFPADEI
jgi:putative exosortase-associated protein (TIGR04073 family)